MAFEFNLGDEVELIVRGKIIARTESANREDEYLVEGRSIGGGYFKKFVGVSAILPANDNEEDEAQSVAA